MSIVGNWNSRSGVIRPGAMGIEPGSRLSPVSTKDMVSVTTLATESLRSAILTGRLVPGERLRQDQLAAALGVSRQPVREALKQLENEGLIRTTTNGVFTRTFTDDDIRENYRLRELLEGEAASLAARNLDADAVAYLELLNGRLKPGLGPNEILRTNYQFHKGIRAAANSPKLDKFIDELWFGITVATPLTIPGRVKRSVREHALILVALSAGDPSAAREAIRVHINNAANEYFAGRLPDTK